MAIFHFTVSVRSRAKGSSSSIAGSAYLSGQKRKDEREGRSWNFANKEEEVLFHQVLLPESAPKKWKQQADRGEYAKVANTLWNSVEKAESQSNARVCRNFEWAMPNELPLDEQKRLASEFIQKYLVDQGMCVEYSICLKIGENGQPNIHVHTQATLRRIKEDETWEAKTQKKYLCRNSEGEEKYLRPEGLKEQPEFQKVYKYRVNGKIEKWTPEQAEQYVKSQNPNIEPKALRQELKDLRASKYALYENAETVDWNEKGKVEEWRAAWAETANKYLEKYGQEIDHRSYERQGIDRIPTIHEGYMSKKLADQGKISDRARINQEIKQANQKIALFNQLLTMINRLKDAFKNAVERISQKKDLSFEEQFATSWYKLQSVDESCGNLEFNLKKSESIKNQLMPQLQEEERKFFKNRSLINELKERISNADETLRAAKNDLESERANKVQLIDQMKKIDPELTEYALIELKNQKTIETMSYSDLKLAFSNHTKKQKERMAEEEYRRKLKDPAFRRQEQQKEEKRLQSLASSLGEEKKHHRSRGRHR